MLPPKPNKTQDALLFMDSGAHTLWNMHCYHVSRSKRYDYFKTPDFWEYVDAYAKFVNDNLDAIDWYVSVDAIHNPEITWEVQKYLEEKHGLDPVPVVHMGTPLKWMEKYLAEGYTFIGIGGVAREGDRENYRRWADTIFNLLCPAPSRLPIVKTHGFAMTSFNEMTRYPFWSVDSVSWAKAAAYGSVYVPCKRNRAFSFDQPPHVVCFSHRSPSAKVKGRNYSTFSADERKIIREWLEVIEIPLGKMGEEGEVIDEGVINHYGSRGVANMRYFDALCKSLPEWPWPFKVRVRGGFNL